MGRTAIDIHTDSAVSTGAAGLRDASMRLSRLNGPGGQESALVSRCAR
jgi:hypothetical protein